MERRRSPEPDMPREELTHVHLNEMGITVADKYAWNVKDGHPVFPPGWHAVHALPLSSGDYDQWGIALDAPGLLFGEDADSEMRDFVPQHAQVRLGGGQMTIQRPGFDDVIVSVSPDIQGQTFEGVISGNGNWGMTIHVPIDESSIARESVFAPGDRLGVRTVPDTARTDRAPQTLGNEVVRTWDALRFLDLTELRREVRRLCVAKNREDLAPLYHFDVFKKDFPIKLHLDRTTGMLSLTQDVGDTALKLTLGGVTKEENGGEVVVPQAGITVTNGDRTLNIDYLKGYHIPHLEGDPSLVGRDIRYSGTQQRWQLNGYPGLPHDSAIRPFILESTGSPGYTLSIGDFFSTEIPERILYTGRIIESHSPFAPVLNPPPFTMR